LSYESTQRLVSLPAGILQRSFQPYVRCKWAAEDHSEEGSLQCAGIPKLGEGCTAGHGFSHARVRVALLLGTVSYIRALALLGSLHVVHGGCQSSHSHLRYAAPPPTPPGHIRRPRGQHDRLFARIANRRATSGLPRLCLLEKRPKPPGDAQLLVYIATISPNGA
jgi:hypothetical protein